MAGYTIGEVEEMTGVKVHFIRYCEGEVPMIQPKRDRFGRRVYSERDVQLLKRLKYLLYEQNFTVAGARHQLYKEFAGGHQDLYSQIALLRIVLLDIYKKVHTFGERFLQKRPSFRANGQITAQN